ncbi:MAG: elongation factor P hydroxylase [Luminiphilus sp.]|nr:elongation factor P hydroxylase [Luminiphilus sp.]
MAKDTNALLVENIFQQCFASDFRTRLVGGADEPLYLPGTEVSYAEIHYRSDFQRSALHEVAHWCVAGPRRRCLPDYGYWYSADDRDLTKQTAFFCVEAKPQALESFFCAAAGIEFTASIDNLSLKIPQGLLKQFHKQLRCEQNRFDRNGLPRRAARFSQALHQARQSGDTACVTA